MVLQEDEEEEKKKTRRRILRCIPGNTLRNKIRDKDTRNICRVWHILPESGDEHEEIM